MTKIVNTFNLTKCYISHATFFTSASASDVDIYALPGGPIENAASLSTFQIFLHSLQIRNQHPAPGMKKEILLQLLIAEAFSPSFFCPVPEFHQSFMRKVIKFIPVGKK